MSALSIGIDMGGSHITCLSMNKLGQVHSSIRLSITNRSIDSVLIIIHQGIEAVLSPQVKYIGMGVPGNVDPIKGTTRYLPNFGWYDEIPLGRMISEKFTLPVTLRNDGRCAAIAESRLGCGVHSKVFVMLTIGTGIGGALVIDGKLFDGSSFDAGDFGHHVICSGNDAFHCVCGKYGCFEYHASADGLVRHYSRMIQRVNQRIEQENEMYQHQYHQITNAQEFIECYRKDPTNHVLKETLISYQQDLATGLANIVTFYNPDTICLGGGLAQAKEIFENLEATVNDRTLPATRGKVRIIPAQLGIHAGAYGAALLGFLAEAEGEEKKEKEGRETE